MAALDVIARYQRVIALVLVTVVGLDWAVDEFALPAALGPGLLAIAGALGIQRPSELARQLSGRDAPEGTPRG